MKYTVEFVTDHLVKQDEEKKGLVRTEQPNIEQQKDKSQGVKGFSSKHAMAGLSLIGTANVGVNILHNHNQTTLSIRGDNFGAQVKSKNMALMQEGLNIGTTLAAGAVFGGLPGVGVAAVGIGISYGMKAFNHSNELRRYQADVMIDNAEKQYMRDRLIQNVTEVR